MLEPHDSMKKYLLFALTLFVAAEALAGTSPFKVVYGPWIQNVTEDSFTVLWVSEQKALSWIELGEDQGLTWYQTDHESYYETVTGRRVTGTFHSVTVSGLKKATGYCYRILGKPIADDSNPYAISYGATRAAKGTHRIRTLDYSADECNFSMVNDMHFDDAKYKALMSGMDKKKTDFIVLNGDIVSFSNYQDTLIKHTFGPISDICGDYPVYFARGNHETRGSEFHMLPKAFPTNTGEFYYTFRQGPVAFLVLDAGEDKPDSDPEYSDQAEFDKYRQRELEWIKEVVKTPLIAEAPVKICIIHIPTFTGPDKWYTQNWIGQHFTPVLNEAGIDLMLSGHHHRYIMAKPGEYGNNYPIVANSNEERMDVHATAGKIEVRTYDRNGALLHSLTF